MVIVVVHGRAICSFMQFKNMAEPFLCEKLLTVFIDMRGLKILCFTAVSR
jgi:hypothetical protein